jgi:nitroreductase/NAD-dependent dihydropyrimidine dehydrogenase PreA subunit
LDLFKIDTEKCNQDGICVETCAGAFIQLEEGGYPTQSDDAEELCIRCGACVAVCPTGSFSLRGMPQEECPPVRRKLRLTEEHCEHFLRYRRTIRVFKDKPVPKEDLTRLIEMARYAPSGFNSQCTEWLVLGNKDELNKLAGIIADWMRWMVNNMPEIASAIHLQKDLSRWDEGVDVLLQDAPVVIVAHADKDNHTAFETCIIALTYLELAATSMGLGCCWAGYLEKAATYYPPMREALGLPEGHKCYGAMMVGYPKYRNFRFPTRKQPTIDWRL